ncbi:MAG: HAMP domain-containing sensor histidine kinase [Oscillospiraceae bacterium]|nr:HAMP domain-containing sensor histidine kinase [Oscillospiraceae bacterium]
MKIFNRIFALIIIFACAVIVLTNVILFKSDNSGHNRPYRVEISRIARQIDISGYESIDLSGCKYITYIEKYCDNDDIFYNTDSDYCIKEINSQLYRFDYSYLQKSVNIRICLAVNLILVLMTVFIILVLMYIRSQILMPFNTLTDVPYELSKGNLVQPLSENRTRFFGKFVWGVNLLRDKMEMQKQNELQLQKDKKTLLLSISHDIKTPLSAIKLYSKSLSKGLYKDKQKQIEVAESINAKADEIEDFISQLIRAAGEDFLNFEVSCTEFYLSDLVNKISNYYSQKLDLINTGFDVGSFSDALLKADFDRSIEVLQNIMENAIKYGDGHIIKITFSEEDNCRLVTIINSGCTLNDNELLHIFDSFWRGSNSHSKSGSGLGLYICRELMSAMNGDIFAAISEDEMEITVVFPMA